MKRKNTAIPTLILLFILLFVSCKKDSALYILTDRVDVVNLVNIYNRETDSDVSVKFVSNVTNTNEGGNIDIIISQNLNSPEFRQEFSNITLKSEYQYYEELLDICRFQDKLKLMPISFNLLILKYLKGTYNIPKISVEDMKYLGYEGTNLLYVRDEGELLYTLMMIEGFSFYQNGKLSYDDEKLISTLDLVVKKYSLKDMKVESDYNLLEDGYILTKFENTYNFYSQKEIYKYDFSFLTDKNGNLIADSDIVYLAILKKSSHQEFALTFLKWILASNNQKKYLDYAKQMSVLPFGFLSGYSITKETNALILKNNYKILNDMKPVVFEVDSYSSWSDLKHELVIPALQDIVFMSNTDKKSNDKENDKIHNLKLKRLSELRLDIENKLLLLKKEEK